ncbi:MAG: class I SAM-dependent methyltransferase [Gloeomargaritaceae cyanobacterium C42_A2020_066]|nr:class I SAM-dependent methyltransferase [Gloeomargaritaceae cyanobacterium C42_A2020_066]
MNAPQHDSQQVKQFFDRWHLYQQIIAQDYMAHRGIHAALRAFVVEHLEQPFTLLDLGCGDASAIANTFSGTALHGYTGVDLSPVALALAADNLKAVAFAVRLVEADLTDYVGRTKGEQFDVVLLGFALHHLYTDEKRVFFQRCHTLLKPGGYLLLYDVFRRPHETRDQYLQAYFSYCTEHWTELSQDSLVGTRDHAYACDYPETYGTLAALARDGGFIPPTLPLFADEPQFHCLYSFQAEP